MQVIDEGEIIKDVKHGRTGESDELPCDPACQPGKGEHVLGATLDD